MYEKIKQYYSGGYWSRERVKNAVGKGVITPDEYREITGEEYT